MKDLSPAELGILKRDHKKELAQFIVALYSFAEVDAHSGNWGVIKTADGRMRILKIDHDMSFFNLLLLLSSFIPLLFPVFLQRAILVFGLFLLTE